MAFAPLQLRGNKKIGIGDAGTPADVDDQVIDFRIVAKRATVEVPKTYGQRKSFRAGDDDYTLEIRFLQDIDPTEAISMIFWDAIGDPTGTINFTATLHDGAVSASNPEWSGIGVVTGADLGGTVDATGITTVSMPLKARPTKSTGA